MNKKPKASTLNNFASAWNRLIKTAIDKCYLSKNAKVPRLSTQGAKSNPRPAFTRSEIDNLLEYTKTWSIGGRNDLEKEKRLLLRDYVEVLLYTGIRHVTESMGFCWNNIEWYPDKGVRYLRLWVDGKTGGRWLIAKHKALDALQRLHQPQTDIANIEFEDLFKTPIPHKLFCISNN